MMKILKFDTLRLGSGIRRALKNQPNIQLIDDKESNKFRGIITRDDFF